MNQILTTPEVPKSNFLRRHKRVFVLFAAIAAVLLSCQLLFAPRIESASPAPELLTLSGNREVRVSVTIKSLLPVSASLFEVEPGDIASPRYGKVASKVATLEKTDDGTYAGSFSVTGSTAATKHYQVVARTALSPFAAKSEKGMLRVILTQRPYNLPPDPDPENDATLEGIDSNRDGLRDDLEREAFFLAPDSERERLALLQNAKAEAGYYLAWGKAGINPMDVANDYQDAGQCLYGVFLVLNDPSNQREFEKLLKPKLDFIHSLALNTRERNDKAKEISSLARGAGGRVGKPFEWDYCSFAASTTPD